MTVCLLLSDREPPFELLRRRLSSCSEKAFAVVLSESLPVDEVLRRAGLTACEPLTGFEVMEGMHRIDCDRAVLLLARMSRSAFLKNADLSPDFVIDETIGNPGAVKRFLADGAVLLLVDEPEKLPPFLEKSEEGIKLRHRDDGVKTSADETDRSVLIVGAGLSGSMMAWELAKRGFHPTVVDGGMVAGSAASALYAGLIHPHWQASDSPVFQLTRRGFSAMLPLLKRFPDTFLPVGVIDAASSDEEFERWTEAYGNAKPIAMSEGFARLLSREEASRYTGLQLSRGGWLFPQAGLVHAGKLCRRLIDESGARFIPNTRVTLRREEGRWTAVNQWGVTVARAKKAVVAAALGSADVLGIPREWLGMNGLYGRITLLRDIDLPTLKTALTGDGYVAKTPDGFCAVGATYEPGEERGVSVAEAHEHNLTTFPKLTGAMPEVVARGFYEGIRAVAQDRMPLAGRGFTAKETEGLSFKARPEARAIPRAEDLWICTGFGSRGITWGLACAETVAAEMAGEPTALTKALKASVDPARFMPKILDKIRTES